MKKVLVITYYWPPSGGAGVQRWVKLTKYLIRNGIAPIVITVASKKASYYVTDETLQDDVHEGVRVYKTDSFEPLKLYSKIFKKEIPAAGFANTSNKGLMQRMVSFLRSHFFIPDPRRGWNSYAFKKASQLIISEKIDTVITSSPPHSTQLIGYKLKKKHKIRWISDLRDPWTDIFYYTLLNHSLLSQTIDKYFEKKVLTSADVILTVSKGLKELFLKKKYFVDKTKIHIIPNGYDVDDFKNTKRTGEINNNFIISYVGTMSEQYKPQMFFYALKNIIEKNAPHKKIVFRLVGNIAPEIEEKIDELGLTSNYLKVKYVAHKTAIDYMLNSSCLLLIIPAVSNSKGILTGKLMEYLSSKKPILCIGEKNSDAAALIDECGAGETFERNNQKGVEDFIDNMINDKLVLNFNNAVVEEYSRSNQALKIKEIILD